MERKRPSAKMAARAVLFAEKPCCASMCRKIGIASAGYINLAGRVVERVGASIPLTTGTGDASSMAQSHCRGKRELEFTKADIIIHFLECQANQFLIGILYLRLLL